MNLYIRMETLDLVIAHQGSSHINHLVHGSSNIKHLVLGPWLITISLGVQSIYIIYIPPVVQNDVTFRRYKAIDMEKILLDLAHKISSLPDTEDPGTRVTAYNSTIDDLMKNHTPLLKKVIHDSHQSLWMTSDILSNANLSMFGEIRKLMITKLNPGCT